MPYLSLIIPQIPAGSKDEFLAAWPTVAAAMKAEPSILGVSAGPIVAADGHAVTEFQFLQCLGKFRLFFLVTRNTESLQHSQHSKIMKLSLPAISFRAMSRSTKQKPPVRRSWLCSKSLTSQLILSQRITRNSRVL